MPSPHWLRQPTWFIDPLNVTGLASDRNDGHDATHPLLSHDMLARRWGLRSLLPQITDVTYLSAPADASDPIYIPDLTLGSGVTLRYTGAQTQVATGTISTFTDVTGNDACIITVTWTIGTTFSGREGLMAVMTSGTQTGAVFHVASALSSTSARITHPCQVVDTYTTGSPTEVAVAPGDTFKLVTTLTVPLVAARVVGPSRLLNNFSRLLFRDFTLGAGTVGPSSAPQSYIIGSEMVIASAIRCTFVCMEYQTIQSGGLYGSRLSTGQYGGRVLGNFPQSNVANCLVDASLPGGDGAIIGLGSGRLIFQNCIVQSTGIGLGGTGRIALQNVGIFDSPSDGLLVNFTATESVSDMELVVSPTRGLFGKGNAGVGVNVAAGKQFEYLAGTKPTITGSSPGVNDVSVGGMLLPWSDVPVRNSTNGAAVVEHS